MTLGEKLSKKKFKVISVLGFTVLILSWLFGLKSFIDHSDRCINVWNPKQFGSRYRSESGYEPIKGFIWTQNCATAAVPRRFDIIFFGVVLFVGLVFGYLLLCWRTVNSSIDDAD